MKNIENYTFVDCLLVDFTTDKLMSSLVIVVESYYPSFANASRQKGLLMIRFNGITQLVVKKTSEFDKDILLAYSEDGDDLKANEVHSVDIKQLSSSLYGGSVESDMIQIELQFKSMELTEVDKTGLDQVKA